MLSVFLARAAEAVTFVPGDKSNQKRPLCPQSEKTKNHRQSFIRFKVRESLYSSPLFINICLSVIFHISTLCYSSAFYPSALFKNSFLKGYRYFIPL